MRSARPTVCRTRLKSLFRIGVSRGKRNVDWVSGARQLSGCFGWNSLQRGKRWL